MSFTSSTLFLVLIFVILTLQATCYFSLLRYSRTRSNKIYFTSMAVLLAEVVKLFTMLVAIFFQCGNVKAFTLYLIANLFVDHKATFLLSDASRSKINNISGNMGKNFFRYFESLILNFADMLLNWQL